jgi:hypothetical protein
MRKYEPEPVLERLVGASARTRSDASLRHQKIAVKKLTKMSTTKTGLDVL